MNTEEIKKEMNFFYENNTAIVLETYFVLKKEETEVLKRVDLDGDAQAELKDEFFQTISRKIIDNDELEVQYVSEATDEKNKLLQYDLEKIPDSLSIINNLTTREDWELYSFDTDKLSEVTGVIFLIHKDEKTLVTYKKTYAINLYRKDSRGLRIWKPRTSERFVEVTEDIYNIYPDMDLFMLDGELYIFDLKILERFFGFHDVIVSSANDAIEKIDDIGILVDTEILKNVISEMSQARKLTQVGMHSPVVSNVTSEDIIDFVNTHPALTGKFKFDEDKDRKSVV